jgi:hypothetical protein
MYGLIQHGSTIVAKEVLAEASVRSVEPIQFRVMIPPKFNAIGFECNRGVPNHPMVGRGCLVVDHLAPPNSGTEFVQPMEVPSELLTRTAYSKIVVDATRLPPGYYFLPTFDYRFLKIVGADGKPVQTMQFDTRPVVRHTGEVSAITISYDLDIELAAVALGVLIAVVYGVIGSYIRIDLPWTWKRGPAASSST